MPTVEDALVRALNDDLIDYKDQAFAHSLASWHEGGKPLTPRQRLSVYELLNRYGVTADDPTETDPPIAPTAGQLKPRKSGVSLRYVDDGDRIAILAPFKYKDICKAMPGRRWHPEQKFWSVPAVPTTAEMCAKAFPGADLDDRTQQLVDMATADRDAPREQNIADLAPIPVALTDPWPHQLRAYYFAVDKPAAMLAMDMGTGKTKVAIDVMRNNDARNILIQCPTSVVDVWAREFRVHAGEHFHVETLTGITVKKRTEEAERLLHRCACLRPHALVINYEGAWREPFGDWALKQDWDYVVFDESHRIKAPQGRQSKFCAKLRRGADRALALSGTPMAQSPLDIWGQYRALDPNIFGPSFTSFRHRYAIMGGWQGKEVVGMNPAMEDELAQLYFSIAYEVDSSVLDLPEPRDVTRSTDLTSKNAKRYKSLENDLYAEIDESEVTVPNVLVKILRLQQLTGGVMKDDEGDEHVVGSEKAALLKDVLDDIEVHNQPVAVFCRFLHDLDSVREATEDLGHRYGELSGRQNDLTEDAHMPNNVDVLGVQIQAGGVGIDLTRAKVGIYYSVGHSLSDYHQSRARLVRPGQDNNVVFVHLVCSGTIDEEVYTALANNQEVIDRVLEKGRS